MRDLARHIDLLLRENDCVILPGFGGFIAHNVPAYYVSEENVYYPPSRSISFNAAITMNDGLLVQSFMKSYQVDYARATYMVDIAIEKLLDRLDEEGTVSLPRIGTIHQNIHRALQFTPESIGIDSPAHFGLGSFSIKELTLLHEPAAEAPRETASFITHTEKTIDVHIHKSRLRQVISTAAVLLLLLMVALPIGDHRPTDIASLNLTEIIATPHKASIPTETFTVIETSTTQEAVDSSLLSPVLANMDIANGITETEEIVIEETVQVAATAVESPQATTVEKATKTYHIIVASLPNHRGAEETLNSYISKGYTQVSLVERDDRVRISLVHFSNKDEANEYLKVLRENETFQNAWLLAVRN